MKADVDFNCQKIYNITVDCPQKEGYMTRVKKFIELIERKILSNQLEIGERLDPERILAQKYSFSRQTVHNGLIRLEEKGLITIKPRQGAFVSDYKTYGKLNLLDTLIGFDKEAFNEETARGFVNFCRLNINEAIRLCTEEKKFDDEEEIINKIGYIKNTEGIQERETLIFEIYRLYCKAQGNNLYLYLINSFKEGIENIVHYTALNDEDYYQLSGMLLDVYEHVVASDAYRAIKSNNEIIDFLEKHWK